MPARRVAGHRAKGAGDRTPTVDALEPHASQQDSFNYRKKGIRLINSHDFDPPFLPRVSRRKFIATGMMLPLSRIAPASTETFFDRPEEIAPTETVVKESNPAFPPYPGALVGFWCAPNERTGSDESKPQQSWVLDIPTGWLATTITLAYESSAKGRESDITSVEVLLDGKPAGHLQPLASQGSNQPSAGWLNLSDVPKGSHQFAVASKDAGLKLAGAWVTNGLLSFWPGHPMVLSADQNFWPGNLRIVPRPVDDQLPLEFGRQGLSSHINQQGLMGIADSRMTAVPGSLRLRYSDTELNVMVKTSEGLRRVKDICPDFHFGLLDGFLPSPVARFTYDHVRYAVTFAAIPEAGEAADLVHVAAWNESSESRANQVALLLDGSADVAVQGATAIASKEVIAYFGGDYRARQATRPVGYVNPRAQPVGIFLAPILDPSSMEWDPSLYSARVSWGKEPVVYFLRCPPGEHYVVYLGVIKLPKNTWAPGSSVRQISTLSVEGAKQVRAESTDLKAPELFRFDAYDENHDGLIEIRSSPPAEIDGAVASLSAIWVFPAGATVDMELLRRGKLANAPLHYVNAGGTAVSWYIDIFPDEDFSFAFVDISSERVIPPGGKQEFWAALPVNHRGEPLPTGGARAWREVDEGTPAYASRLQKRLAAARLAADSPAKALDKVRAYWAAILEGPRLQVPEDSVMHLARTSHCYFRILRYPLSDVCAVPMGGDAMDYYDFSERDSAYEITGLDATGRHKEAEFFLNIYLARRGDLKTARWPLGQDDQGRWMTRSHEEDTQGFVLWALGEHYMLSRDKVWLAQAWPWIKRGLEYIRRTLTANLATISDPADPRHGLWIPGSGEMMANELSYWYWYNYFIETALRYGVVEAEAMGERDFARALQQEHAAFVTSLRRSMRQRFNRLDYRRGLLPGRANGDQILDVALTEGSVFPSHSLPPLDPMVSLSLGYTDSLAWARSGSLPVIWYGSNGRGIWPALTGDYAMMHLRRGEAEKTVDCFYAMLSTCGEINSWGEVMSWDNGISTGGQPYMWANGIFLVLLRNMLLHEEGEWFDASPAGPKELWICPATPRKWMHEPTGIVVEHAPTYFGPVSFSLRAQANGDATGTIVFEGTEKLPQRLVVHVRSLREGPLRRVTVNGRDHAYFTVEQIVIADPPRKIEIVCS